MQAPVTSDVWSCKWGGFQCLCSQLFLNPLVWRDLQVIGGPKFELLFLRKEIGNSRIFDFKTNVDASINCEFNCELGFWEVSGFRVSGGHPVSYILRTCCLAMVGFYVNFMWILCGWRVHPKSIIRNFHFSFRVSNFLNYRRHFQISRVSTNFFSDLISICGKPVFQHIILQFFIIFGKKQSAGKCVPAVKYVKKQ